MRMQTIKIFWESELCSSFILTCSPTTRHRRIKFHIATDWPGIDINIPINLGMERIMSGINLSDIDCGGFMWSFQNCSRRNAWTRPSAIICSVWWQPLQDICPEIIWARHQCRLWSVPCQFELITWGWCHAGVGQPPFGLFPIGLPPIGLPLIGLPPFGLGGQLDYPHLDYPHLDYPHLDYPQLDYPQLDYPQSDYPQLD